MAFGTLSSRRRGAVPGEARRVAGREDRRVGGAALRRRRRCRCRWRARRRRRGASRGRRRCRRARGRRRGSAVGEHGAGDRGLAGQPVEGRRPRGGSTPWRAVEVAEVVGGGGRRDAGEDARRRLDERDLEALLAQHGGRLEADVAAADDQRPAPAGERWRRARRRRRASRISSTPARAPPIVGRQAARPVRRWSARGGRRAGARPSARTTVAGGAVDRGGGGAGQERRCLRPRRSSAGGGSSRSRAISPLR